jgi:hypothetical protein
MTTKGLIPDMPQLAVDICRYLAHNVPRMNIIAFYDRCMELQKEDEKLFSDRMIRCLLFVSQGDLDKLEQAIALAKQDYRDLIVAAEYDGSENHIRNFNHPFEIENGGFAGQDP